MIKTVNSCYSNEEDEKTRSFEDLDPFRHPDFPDDVRVIIENEQLRKREQIWVRLTKYAAKSKNGHDIFMAKLLDEPFEDIYGMHQGDEIVVAHFVFSGGDSMLLGMGLK